MTTRQSYLKSQSEYSTNSQRLEFLYSSLSSRKKSNLTGFNSALTWWRLNLSGLVSRGFLGEDRLILVVDDDLRENLRWGKIGRPSSLGIIISELASTSDFIPLRTYLSSSSSNPSSSNNSSWISLLAKPLWWSLSTVKTTILGSNDSIGESAEEATWRANKGDWVIQELVDKAAIESIPKLNELHYDALSRLYTLKSFHSTLNSISDSIIYSERDALVLAKHLSTKGLCVLSGEAIKFLPLTKLTSPPTSTTYTITTSDLSILTLLSTLSSLATYISSLEERIASEQLQVLKYNSLKQLRMVKSHLINRKRLEGILNERIGSRNTMSEVLSSIERAKGDEEALQAISLGTTTLRQILSSPTLSLENIQATTDLMEETLTDAQEIDRAVESIGALSLNSEEEEAVEKELREMVEAEERAERMRLDEIRLEKEEVERRAREEMEKLEKERLEVERLKEEERVRDIEMKLLELNVAAAASEEETEVVGRTLEAIVG